jgi:protein phosphatase PTC7
MSNLLSHAISLPKNSEYYGFVPCNCGEDSFFINNSCFGVWDGVGGWNHFNVNPALIARHMCLTAYDVSKTNNDVYDILLQSYNKIKNEIYAGSTTCCFLSLDYDTMILKSANIGDSGYIIIRNGTLHFSSDIQRYNNEIPYQLAIIPDEFKYIGAVENIPSDCDIQETKIKKDDIIILATDGLWDNMSIVEICKIVNKSFNKQCLDIAQELVEKAKCNNIKKDDITVIVSKVI